MIKTPSKLPVLGLLLMAFTVPALEALMVRALSDLNYLISPVKLLPAAAAYGLLILSLRGEIQISFRWARLGFHLFCVLIFWAGSAGSAGVPFWYDPFHQAPAVHYLAVYFLTVLMFVSGLFLWINPFLYFAGNKPAFVFAFLAGTSRIAYDAMNHVLWRMLAHLYIPALVSSLHLMGFETSRAADSLIIFHPSLPVRIQPGCSGLDGVFFFIGVFSALMIFDFRKFSAGKSFKIFAAGSLLMLFLNYLRLAAFLIYGYWLSGTASSPEVTRATLDLFHSNVGWLLYGAGIFGWTGWVYRHWENKTDRLNLKNLGPG